MSQLLKFRREGNDNITVIWTAIWHSGTVQHKDYIQQTDSIFQWLGCGCNQAARSLGTSREPVQIMDIGQSPEL